MNLNSGLPLWLIRAGIPHDYPTLTADVTTEVTVIGGGISGALMAYELQKAGVGCVVIDRRTVGLGSTCASTSLLQYEIDVPLSVLCDKIGLQEAVAAYKLCEAAVITLQDIAKEIGFKDIQPQRSLYFATKKRKKEFLKREFDLRKEHGFPVSLLDQQEVRDEFNISSQMAILSDVAAQTNAYTFTHALHQYNISKGCQVFDRTEAEKINHQQGKIVIKTNRNYSITTNKIVYATGYESVKYIDKKIVSLTSTYAIATEQIASEDLPIARDILMWNTDDPYLYMRSTSDNRIIIGGLDERYYDPERRDRLIERKSRKLEEILNETFPKRNLVKEFSWCGTFGSTEDGLPFIGSYKNPNCYFALGFGGNGITFSVIAATFLTNEICGKQNSYGHLFSFNRA